MERGRGIFHIYKDESKNLLDNQTLSDGESVSSVQSFRVPLSRELPIVKWIRNLVETVFTNVSIIYFITVWQSV